MRSQSPIQAAAEAAEIAKNAAAITKAASEPRKGQLPDRPTDSWTEDTIESYKEHAVGSYNRAVEALKHEEKVYRLQDAQLREAELVSNRLQSRHDQTHQTISLLKTIIG